MERVYVVLNPTAGRGQVARRWPQLAARLRAMGIDFHQCVTCGPGDGAVCGRAAVADGADLVIVVGGDGTVNEVVNGCRAAGAALPRLALLPVGTGADFARGLGLRDEATALAALRGAPRAVDLGLARYTGADGTPRERYFLNVADCGLGPATSARARRGPRGLGPLAYLYGALGSIVTDRPVTIRVVVDDIVVYDGPSSLVAVANGRYFGGGMRVAPDADPADGLFDVLVLAATSRRVLVADLLPRVYRGTHLDHPAVHVRRGHRVAVTATAPFPLEVDGEAAGSAPVTFALLPGALPLLAAGRAFREGSGVARQRP